MRILFNVNAAWFFISHRLELGRAARTRGFEVHVSADIESSEEVTTLEKEGFVFHRVHVKRGGLNPIHDASYLWEVASITKCVRPDIVHNVTVKPIVYGTLAGRMFRVSGIVNAVSGLGYAFSGNGVRRALSVLVKGAYKTALNRRDLVVIFQNEEDFRTFVEAGIVREHQGVLIRGSGVDLDVFTYSEECSGRVVVMLPARMLRDKGVIEFARAARILRSEGVEAEFVLAGRVDAGNPAGLSVGELRQLESETGVRWIGHVKDMPTLYRKAHVVCLPSYREGFPKSLIEACACGRAIVATDVPGCRDAVSHLVNGILVPPRDVPRLAEAVRVLINDGALRRGMGAAGRERAESEFDVALAVRATLDVYEQVLERRRA